MGSLSGAKSLRRLIKEAVDKWGTVDILVNNAGITRDTLIMRMKPEQWQDVINTNLTGVFYATQVLFVTLPYVSQKCAVGIVHGHVAS